MHAGEGETSLLLYLTSKGKIREKLIKDVDSPHRPLLETLGMKPYTSTGTIGFPTKATPEKGRILFQELIRSISLTVEEYLEATN
jgi:creatinine amidohydrolase